ncbi:protein-lysine N-methyltransferase EEF2KMT isoform X2 [Bombina bombina]|nr:protein-lysine N-methyltransferase EEF2KMT isoform X2 [Bombina bombina]
MDISLCDTFHRSFLSCRRLGSLPWVELEKKIPSDSSLVLDILHKTILHPLCQKYPPSLQYRRLFLSEVIKRHERTGAEPLDELYNALAEVLNAEETNRCYKSYLLPSGDAVTLSENPAIISGGTTGLVTWEAALYLAEWATENASIFKDRTVLELGSGTGLAGLAICKSCFPKKYIFSDCHQQVLQQLKENLLLNGYLLDKPPGHLVTEDGSSSETNTTEISVLELDWESITDRQLGDLQAGVVIASDVVYDPEIIIPFIRVLINLFKGRNDGRKMEMLIASTIRNVETYGLFQKALDEAGLRWQVLPEHKKTLFPYDTTSKVEMLKLNLKSESS